MANFKRVRPGDPITAEAYNAIAERLERFANLSIADGGHLRLWSSPTGKSLALAAPRETIARLSGDSSPYSWTEVIDAEAGASIDRPNANQGVTNAYEVNGTPNLNGAIVWLAWSAAGDWRFQWVGHSSAPLCENGRICLTIDSDGCSPPSPVFGATVTVTDSAEPPNTIGTAVTTGQITALTLTHPGSGYTDGTGYPLDISGDGSDATGTFDVSGGKVSNLTLLDGGTGYTSASITFPGAGPGTGALATATAKGRCCIAIPASATYTVKVQLPGAADIITTVNAVCNQDNAVSVSYPAGSLGTFCIKVMRCSFGYNILPIFIYNNATPLLSKPTNINGHCCIIMGSGTGYSYSLTVDGGETYTGDFSIGTCATTTRFLTFINNYNFQIRVDPTERNKGCTGSFSLYEDFDNSGTLLLSQSITVNTDESGLSPIYTIPITELQIGAYVFYELIFSNYTFSGSFPINCTGPSTPDIFDIRADEGYPLDQIELC